MATRGVIGAFATGSDGTYAAATGGGSSTSLVIQDATHAHASLNFDLSSDQAIVIADATHGHIADNIGLTVASVLAVADAAHSHTADNLTLSTSGTVSLVLADATHAHAADNLAFTTDSTLVVAESIHAHTADSPLLTAQTLLAVADGTHAHTADNLTVTQSTGDTDLVIQSATHAHQADSVAFVSDQEPPRVVHGNPGSAYHPFITLPKRKKRVDEDEAQDAAEAPAELVSVSAHPSAAGLAAEETARKDQEQAEFERQLLRTLELTLEPNVLRMADELAIQKQMDEEDELLLLLLMP